MDLSNDLVLPPSQKQKARRRTTHHHRLKRITNATTATVMDNNITWIFYHNPNTNSVKIPKDFIVK